MEIKEATNRVFHNSVSGVVLRKNVLNWAEMPTGV